MQIGIDGVHCTIVFKKQIPIIETIDKNLKNSDGTTYGNVKSFGEQIKLKFNVPLMLRDNNVKPFDMKDAQQVSYIKTKLLIDLNRLFGNKIKTIVPNAIEVNVTKKLKYAKTCEVIRLLKLAYLDKNQQLLVWLNKGENENYEKTTGLLTGTKTNEYRLKVYDKSNQMLNEKGKLIEPNTLRLEMIIQGRRIRQTYGNECSLFDILDNIQPLIKVFKLKYENDVKKKVKKYLAESKQIMFEELTNGLPPKYVFTKYRNLIVDSKQIQKTLERFYQFKGKQNQSKSISKVLAKSLCINTGTIKEISELLVKN